MALPSSGNCCAWATIETSLRMSNDLYLCSFDDPAKVQGCLGPPLHIVSRYNALDFASARLEKLPNRLGITIRADCDEHGTPQYYPRVEASCLVNRVNTVSGFIRIAVFISSSTSC
jgi:hypothetical protein